ncbi:unnamed protein product [Cuscuta campestris]|uniref:Peptidase A1 domain-containing protein n=1 Tax=Cuscuta campestris TaxID=132261 RepID=A0A484LGQ8_9ASTE|nr:unnamed protein product [Cuscuta campestris]
MKKPVGGNEASAIEPSPSGFVINPYKYSRLSLEERRELLYEIYQWSDDAPKVLSSLGRRQLLEIICAEMGKERKYPGFTKARMIEHLLKLFSCRRTINTKENLIPDDHPCDEEMKDKPGAFLCQNSACRAVMNDADVFCRRCSCCICHRYDDNKDPSLWLVCCSPDCPEESALILVIFVFLLSSLVRLTYTTDASSTTRIEPEQKNRAALSMTFYGSKYSQVFEPDASFAYRHASELNMSLHRIAYLHEKEIMLSNLSLSQVRENPAYSEVFANYAFGLGLYLVEFYVGDEGLKQVLVLDTGSSIVWVHCQPCENPCGESYKITKPIYDPELSLGYQRVLCKDSYCRNPGTVRTNYNECKKEVEECEYQVAYESARSSGKIIRDTFRASNLEQFSTIYFGCSKSACFDGNAMFLAEVNGVFGLGNERLSFMSQVPYEAQFSYCLGRLPDFEEQEATGNSALIIGEPVIENKKWTNLYEEDGHYYVSIAEIWIGDKKLNPPKYELRRSRTLSGGGALIDTGASINILLRGTFEVFTNEVNRLMGDRIKAVERSREGRPCYLGKKSSEIPKDFPEVRFVFEGYTSEIKLKYYHLFRQVDEDRFCLTFIDGSFKSRSAYLGASAQQSMYVNYDLVEGRISFQDADCSSSFA